MAFSSRTKSSGPVLPLSNNGNRPISSSGRFYSSSKSYSSSSSAFATSSSTFASPSSTFFHRSASPTRVNICGASPSAATVRFSLDRPASPGQSLVGMPRHKPLPAQRSQRKTCMCSPTTHPGSFRCSLHKSTSNSNAVSSPSNRLNARRSAMTNSLVRIGTVEGADWVKRALSALIRPSSHQQKRRAAFQPRPSRLSVMSTAEDIRS